MGHASQGRSEGARLVKVLVGSGRAWSEAEKHFRQRKQHIPRPGGKREPGHGLLKDLKGVMGQRN